MNFVFYFTPFLKFPFEMCFKFCPLNFVMSSASVTQDKLTFYFFGKVVGHGPNTLLVIVVVVVVVFGPELSKTTALPPALQDKLEVNSLISIKRLGPTCWWPWT